MSTFSGMSGGVASVSADFLRKSCFFGVILDVSSMILQFSVSNFRSLKERQTLNFSASNYDKSLPQNCIAKELPGLKGRRWLKAIALYGPNASGKSSVIDALRALEHIVQNSSKTTDGDQSISSIQPFALQQQNASEPTAFALSFVCDNVRYEFRMAATRERVVYESLRSFPDGHERLWYSRVWNPSLKDFEWNSGDRNQYSMDKNRVEYTLPNVLYLSKAVSLGDTQLAPIFRWFRTNLRFLDLSSRQPLVSNTFTAEQFVQNTHLAPSILQLLTHADLGIVNAKVTEEKLEPEFVDKFGALFPSLQESIKNSVNHKVELSHRGVGNYQGILPWELESAGTQRLFALAGPWLDTISNGWTLCIDELETSMHPIMTRELLRLLFADNTSESQIIFTTHNPILLDPTLLRRDQIWFADKDDCGQSHLYPLSDYHPRKGESLVRGYLAGRYGAVPFIPSGLVPIE